LFEIGGSLAAARKGQGLTPADAERLTCLRGKYVAALESDDFDALPGRVYARAFLRTYADALGLDADRFVDEFDSRFPEFEEEPPPAVIRPRRPFRLRPRLVVPLAVAAAFVAAVAWSSVSSSPKLAPEVRPPAARAAQTHPRASLALTPKPKPPPRRFPLVIHATNGPCWLLVRRGGSTGAVLYEGTLEPGKTMHFVPRVWVRLGAPWNVAVHRGTHVVAGLPASTPVNITA
jgi:cytoskeleton protein RodZ